jgi:ketosteroid isomerase-like protein
MKPVLLFGLGALFLTPVATAQTRADSAAVRQAALDYIEGWYDGDAERMARAVHPELAKRIVVRNPRYTHEPLAGQGASVLTQNTAAGGGRETPAARRRKDVTILDIAWGRAASVKIVASDWVDYLHLARVDGAWKIINVLWEQTPPAERGGASRTLPMDSVYARFTRGYQTLQPRMVSELYAEDAFYLSPGDTIRRGRPAIHQAFSRFFGGVRERGDSLSIAFDIRDRAVTGDLGYDVGYYRLTGVPRNGTPRTDTGKFIVIWKRGADGTWRIHADGYSGVAPESGPAGG